jgi:hypothetical protein
LISTRLLPSLRTRRRRPPAEVRRKILTDLHIRLEKMKWKLLLPMATYIEQNGEVQLLQRRAYLSIPEIALHQAPKLLQQDQLEIHRKYSVSHERHP